VVKIVADDRGANDEFGECVSISGDNIIVGAWFEDEDEDGLNTLSYAGSAYLFSKNRDGPDNWGQQKKIVASDRASGDRFGCAVSISGDYAVIGAHTEDEDASGGNTVSGAGSAYIFYKDHGSPGNWGEVKKIVASDRSVYDFFGEAVCISGDNIIVGAFEDDDDANGSNPLAEAGSAYIFNRNEGGENNWGEVNKIDAHNRSDVDNFGETVSITDEFAIAGSRWIGTSGGDTYLFQKREQSTNITFSNITSSSFTINWTKGNLAKRIVVMKAGTSGMPIAVDNTTYSANSVFGNGDELSPGGWYCVYNDTGSIVTVTGLDDKTEYRVVIHEYNGLPGAEMYFTETATGNPSNQATLLDLSGVNVNVANNILSGTTADMQYSLNSSDGINGDWYDCITGNTNVSFSEGNVFVREKALTGNYRLVAVIDPPAEAPAFTINFFDETTTESIPSSIEYNTDNNFTTANSDGAGTVISLTPGIDIYFRYKATASALPSEILTLDVPDRPATPLYTIDYIDETTTENVNTTDEYYTDNNFTSPNNDGDGTVLSLSPGTDVYFRVKATGNSFVSDVQHLVVPPRPAAPSYSVDYINEMTVESVASTDEYSITDDISNPQDGINTKIDLIPGTDIYFRTKATASSFKGNILHLIVPERPPVPIVSLADKNSPNARFKKSSDGTGSDVLESDGLEYSTDGGTSWSLILTGEVVDATGIKHIIVRKHATQSSFVSLPTSNLDFEKPAIIANAQSVCNGPGNTAIVQSNTDNGKVYIVLEGESQSDVNEIEDAIGIMKAAATDVTMAHTDISIVTEGLTPGIYYAYASNLLDSLSDIGSNPITIHEIPTVNLGEDIIKCESTEVTLDPGSGFSTYEWSVDNVTTQTIKVTAEDDYIVTVTDEHGCQNSDTASVRYNIPYQDEQICVVTIDLTTGKNVIVWEKTPDVGITAYHIYRESTIGVYNEIGTIPVNELSIFKDTTANPESQSYLYKITAVDSCGNESLLTSSKYHRPSFLQYVSSEGGVNLEWTDYNIQNVADIGDYLKSYAIYRGTDSIGLTEYQIVGSINTYTDNDPDAMVRRYYYRVAALLKDPCFPTGSTKADSGSYNHSMSNIEDNRLPDTASFVNSIFIEKLGIYPNPFNRITTIRFDNTDGSKYRIYITDLTGKVVYFEDNIFTSRIEFNREELPAGYYFVELRGPRLLRGRMVIE